MQKRLAILILDDEKQFTEELNDFFLNSDFESFQANTVEVGKNILQTHEINLMFLDVRLPGINGLDIMEELKNLYPDMVIIVVSAHMDMGTVSKAIQLGAFDYLRKPFRYIDMQVTIERAQKYLQVQQQLKLTEERNASIYQYIEDKIDRQFIGISPKIEKVLQDAIIASKSPDSFVFITGETGTGKKNIARIIHNSSIRKDHLFCSMSTNNHNDELLESDFFGHKRGAFPDPITDKMGFLEVCNGGTLYIDEVTNLSSGLIEKIVNASKEKAIHRIGDPIKTQTDFRIISSTDYDISKSIDQVKLIPGLLQVINSNHIHIPALRERPEDIKPLTLHFLELFSMEFKKQNIGISDEVLTVLTKYSFPGNVRELRNIVERAVILCTNDTIRLKELPFS